MALSNVRQWLLSHRSPPGERSAFEPGEHAVFEDQHQPTNIMIQASTWVMSNCWNQKKNM